MCCVSDANAFIIVLGALLLLIDLLCIKFILVAGPDRPVPRPTANASDAAEGSDAAGKGDPQSIASSAANSASNLYSRLGNALSERGYVYHESFPR